MGTREAKHHDGYKERTKEVDRVIRFFCFSLIIPSPYPLCRLLRGRLSRPPPSHAPPGPF